MPRPPSAFAPRRLRPDARVFRLQCARKRICTQSSASKISPMECGHHGFSLLVVSKSSQEVVKSAQEINQELSESFLEVVIEVAQKLEITVQPVFGLRFHSSAMEDVVRVTLWRALLNEVWQRGALAPNFLVIGFRGYCER